MRLLLPPSGGSVSKPRRKPKERKVRVFKHERTTAFILGMLNDAMRIDGVASWLNFTDAPIERKKAIYAQALRDHRGRKVK